MRILVTGGAGFIGSHIVDRFIEMGHDVVILDNLTSGNMDNVNPAATFINGDITDGPMVEKLFDEHRFEVVNHHAAQMEVRQSVEDPIFDAQVNILGTINLLKAGARTGLGKFMFASTGGAVYGEQDYFPADEKHPTNPVSPYGISKLACEKYISYFSREYGVPCSIQRYANVYGPRQNPHGEAGVVAIFSKKLSSGSQPTINGDGLQTRDYVYISDVVEFNALALVADTNILLNVGTAIETTVVSLYQTLIEAADADFPAHHGPALQGEQQRSVISSELAKETIGWAPKIIFAEGVTQTYHYFINQRRDLTPENNPT